MTSRNRWKSSIESHPRQVSSLIFALLLAMIVLGALWQRDGLPNSADGPLHLHRAAAYTQSLGAGLLWPRWLSDVYAGFGAPTFHYYSPLFYLCVGFLHRLGMGLDVSALLVLTAAFVLGASCLYAWANRLAGGPAGAVAATALYFTQPFFFHELYFQGDYPQLLALLLLPVSFCLLDAHLRSDTRRLRFTTPIALLLPILSHNLTALVAAPLLFGYWALFSIRTGTIQPARRTALSAILAVGLSAFFWLAALGDSDLVQIGRLQQDFFHYAQYFLSVDELIAPPVRLDSRAANPPLPHSLGWPFLLALILGVGAALASGLVAKARSDRPSQRAAAVWGMLVALVLPLLTLPTSAFVWETLPGLNLLQFPARLLPPATLGAAVAVASAGFARLESTRLRWSLSVFFLAAAIAAGSPFLFPGQPFLSIGSLSSAETQQYERTSGVWGLTSGNEFLPRWRSVETVSSAGMTATEVDMAEIDWLSPHLGQARIDEPSRSTLLSLHYFPGWSVSNLESGRELSTFPSTDGFLAVESVDATIVQVEWTGTQYERQGEWGSLFSLLIWAVLVFSYRNGDRRRNRPTPSNASIPGRLLCILLALGLIRWFGAEPVGALMRNDTAQGEAPPGSSPLFVEFGSGEEPAVKLLGWNLVGDSTPKPGESISLRLFWQTVEPLDASLHSFLHLYSPERSHSWVITQNQNPGRIPTSGWNAALYYVDDLTLALPVDLPPASYTLAVGLVDESGRRLASPEGREGLFYLDDIRIEPLSGGGLPGVEPGERIEAEVADKGLRLRGYDLLPAPGGPILRLYLVPHRTPDLALALHVGLRDPAGDLIREYREPLLSGMLPTTRWEQGRLYIDRRPLPLPEPLPSGDYRFEISLIDEDGAFYGFEPDSGQKDRFEDGRLIVPLFVPES